MKKMNGAMFASVMLTAIVSFGYDIRMPEKKDGAHPQCALVRDVEMK